MIKKMIQKFFSKDNSNAKEQQYFSSSLKHYTSNSFVLDDSAPYELIENPTQTDRPRWIYPLHLDEPRYSLSLMPWEAIKTDVIQVIHGSRLFLRISTGLPKISPDGLGCLVVFNDSMNNRSFHIGEFILPGKDSMTGWREIDLDLNWLSGYEGRIVIECTPGPKGDSIADWLAIADFCVAPETEIKLNLARTHREMRIKNELDHFSAVYHDEMYSKIQEKQRQTAKGYKREVKLLSDLPESDFVESQFEIKVLPPNDDENACEYASRLLKANIATQPPNYIHRLHELVKARGKIKVLSICSGAARLEAGFSIAVPEGVDWTLLDINEELLHMASRQFSPKTNLDLIKGDANNLSPIDAKWDVILCVSALHHIVELEKLMLFIYRSLNEEGEFWSIGEAVGRNGNRLWPEAKQLADSVFSSLPERYRFNAHTKQLDSLIPDNDFSIASFEGIRSEEILPTIDRMFEPLEVYRANCFLWRMLNLAYYKNYDLNSEVDRQVIAGLVKAEVTYYRDGGQGTELFGVFKRRNL